MYLTHNDGKSVVAERFIMTLRNKIYKYMTPISKNVYIDKLDDIVNEYNNICHRTIKMKPNDVKDNKYINIDKEVNGKDPKFQVGDHVRISKYKNIFTKDYTPNWYEETFVIKGIKNTIPWTYVINDLNREEIIGTFYEKELQKTNQEEFKIEKVKPGGDINVKVDLSNYATKTDLKNISHVDVSSLALKSNLASLKTEADKLDIDKLTPVPNDLAKLGNVVINYVVKKTEYDKLVAKLDII